MSSLGLTFTDASSVAGVSATSVQPVPTVTQLATIQAAAVTSSLAASGGAGTPPAILAAGPTGEVLAASSGSAEPRHIAELRQRANKACFVDKDPRQCSIANQLFASAEAARHCRGGAVSNLHLQAKQAGSLWRWFQQPTWVAPVNAASRDAHAVAVTMSTQEPDPVAL